MLVKPEHLSVAMVLRVRFFWMGGWRGLVVLTWQSPVFVQAERFASVLEGDVLLWDTVPPLQDASGDSQVLPLSPSAWSGPVTIFV